MILGSCAILRLGMLEMVAVRTKLSHSFWQEMRVFLTMASAHPTLYEEGVGEEQIEEDNGLVSLHDVLYGSGDEELGVSDKLYSEVVLPYRQDLYTYANSSPSEI